MRRSQQFVNISKSRCSPLPTTQVDATRSLTKCRRILGPLLLQISIKEMLVSKRGERNQRLASFPSHFSPQLRDKIWEWPGNEANQKYHCGMGSRQSTEAGEKKALAKVISGGEGREDT